MTYQIGVVITARNEGDHIAEVVKSCINQQGCNVIVSVCNDGSTDNTREEAENAGAVVVDFPYDHESWVSRPELAKTTNMALSYFKEYPVEYIMISGGDSIFPPGYCKYIINKMKLSNSIIASGESTEDTGNTTRGSGRIVDYGWWRKYKLEYPEIYGWESWLIWRARADGFNAGYYPEMQFRQTRKTGANYNPEVFRLRGRGFKHLGYPKLWVYANAYLHGIIGNKQKKKLQILGYNETEDVYDKELAKFIRSTLLKEMINPGKIIPKAVNILKK